MYCQLAEWFKALFLKNNVSIYQRFKSFTDLILSKIDIVIYDYKINLITGKENKFNNIDEFIPKKKEKNTNGDNANISFFVISI